MGYKYEFPNHGEDTACAAAAAEAYWEDTSWHNDVCPSFTCDVFVLWIDHESDAQREFPGHARYSIHDEGNIVLQTDPRAPTRP